MINALAKSTQKPDSRETLTTLYIVLPFRAFSAAAGEISLLREFGIR